MLISLSGGLDSAVLLAYMIDSGWKEKTTAVSFDYGSKHNRLELESAEKITDHYGVPWEVIDARRIFMRAKSALMDSAFAIPEGHHQDETMRQTVVPGRNLIFASILASLAESGGHDTIFLSVHAGDHFIYPDCRPDFVKALMMTVSHSTSGKVVVYAPFLLIQKWQIVRHGLEWKVPFRLTRTCYTSDIVACGKCGSCTERLEAFRLNLATDPIEYGVPNG